MIEDEKKKEQDHKFLLQKSNEKDPVSIDLPVTVLTNNRPLFLNSVSHAAETLGKCRLSVLRVAFNSIAQAAEDIFDSDSYMSSGCSFSDSPNMRS
jgi:hypothetical protein